MDEKFDKIEDIILDVHVHGKRKMTKDYHKIFREKYANLEREIEEARDIVKLKGLRAGIHQRHDMRITDKIYYSTRISQRISNLITKTEDDLGVNYVSNGK